jgi:hypothetical protein
LNKIVVKAKEAQNAAAVANEENRDNLLASPKTFAVPEPRAFSQQESRSEYAPHMVQGIIDAVQTDEPKDKEFVAAKVEAFNPEEIGEIETASMDMAQKSNLLHQVANSAAQEYKDARDKKPQVPTAEDEEMDRKQSAVELSENAMEYERMDYSAKDLNNFSALTSQQAQKSMDSKALPVPKKDLTPQPVHKPDFYEQLYDSQHSH